MLPDKIDELRSFITTCGRDVTGLVQEAVDRVKGSIAAGQHAYDEAGGIYQGELDKLRRSNEEMIANLHRAVDNFGKLVESAQETFVHPLFEIGAIVRGVDRGARELASSFDRKANQLEPVALYQEQQRVMG